jgi:putative hydrolase of the HAD superfamily
MKPVKAVIFDVYHTLLAVAGGPVAADDRWQELWGGYVGAPPGMHLTEFDEACRTVVASDHAPRKSAGDRWPEVDWRKVACRAAGGLSGLAPGALDDFLFRHAQLQRSTQAMPGGLPFLTRLKQQGILTGIASNAQRYTFDELAAAGLPVDQFEPDLCFWSFEQGFSKPDPAVFSWLTARLAARGIRPEETLMIGDRLDNDIKPARAAGWQVWHFQGPWPVL